MNIYSINLNLVATAYIKADDEDEALAIARDVVNDGLEFSGRHQSVGDNVCVDGRPYACLVDNVEDVALSPAMTVDGLGNEEIEFVEELA